MIGKPWVLLTVMLGLSQTGCMSSQVTGVNSADPTDDGKIAKTLCDLELGISGSPKEGTTNDEREWSSRAFDYPEDLKRCMETKGYRMSSAQ